MTGQLLECTVDETSNVSRLLAFLVTLQAAALDSFGQNDTSFDPKTYVDIILREPLNATENAFLALERSNGIISNATVTKFVADYFDPAGSEVVFHRSPDYTPQPPGFLSNVHNEVALKWAHEVHEIWPTLSRKEKSEVATRSEMYTMVSLKNPFVIPGSRFREVYYWDSYWVIRGLVVSKMLSTARGMVDNLLSMVETYGFVPNGARKYYLNRSQPPFLSEMVKTLVEAAGDLTLVEKALPILIREHTFWTTAPHVVHIQDSTGVVHSLSRYFAKWNTPRPESATIDIEVAEQVEESKRPQLYNDIASTAETGWDFSSRWMEDRFNLSTLRTSKVVPADLNAYLFQMEKNIATFAKLVGDAKTRRAFAKKAEARRAAIEAVLWNEEMKQWNDYWLPDHFCESSIEAVKFDRKARNKLVYASNFVPIWCGLPLSNDRVESIVGALKSSGLIHPAGIATSLIQTGQQWDYPNGWAPLQHMIIEGLHSTRSKAAKTLAEDIAVRWLRTNYATFVATGAMQEKFDVRVCGASGGGGEYTDQTGFGWTNGVVLALFDHFGWPEHRDITCCPSYRSSGKSLN
ncbi:unnamed protein product [Calypogeia fissa]